MDQVTQQNAAMVEEANAAGATLAKEAARLRELVAQFQLGYEGSAAQPARPARLPAVNAQAAPPSSSARGMVNRIASAFSSRGSAAVAVKTESWEEF